MGTRILRDLQTGEPLPGAQPIEVPDDATPEQVQQIGMQAFEALQAQMASEVGAPAGPIEGAGGLAKETGQAALEFAKEEGPAGVASTVLPMVVPGGAIVKGTAAAAGGMAGRAYTTKTREGRWPTYGELIEEAVYGFVPESFVKVLGPGEAGRIVESLGMSSTKTFGKKLSLEEARLVAGRALKEELPTMRRAMKADVDKAYERVRRRADMLGLAASPVQAKGLADEALKTLMELQQLDPSIANRIGDNVSIFVKKVQSGEPITYRELTEFRLSLLEDLPEFGRKRNEAQTALGRLTQNLRDTASDISKGTPVEKMQRKADLWYQNEVIPQRVALDSLINDKVTPDAVANFVIKNPNRLDFVMKRAKPETVAKIRSAALENIFEKSMDFGVLDPEKALSAYRSLDPVIKKRLFENNREIEKTLKMMNRYVRQRRLARRVTTALMQAAALSIPIKITSDTVASGGDVDSVQLMMGLAGSFAGAHVLSRVLSSNEANRLFQRGLLAGRGSQTGIRFTGQALERAGYNWVMGTPQAGVTPAEEVTPSLF